ncbi:hypothetical protein D4764_06G0000490 [Takifugu flavidus]|uniref:Uncharacterized protein n=1 Tax=Takifugu flavidus TaxID=433684 RepID=A0A5C6MUR4_9TELE|nr:hypothetical protein D4764_06G0000490 [Takifugu flavidus]
MEEGDEGEVPRSTGAFEATDTYLVNNDPSRGPGMPECFLVSETYRVPCVSLPLRSEPVLRHTSVEISPRTWWRNLARAQLAGRHGAGGGGQFGAVASRQGESGPHTEPGRQAGSGLRAEPRGLPRRLTIDACEDARGCCDSVAS